MTPTNLAELPAHVTDAWGRTWRKANTDGTEWSLPAPPGATPHLTPFGMIVRSGPLVDPDTGRVVAEKPADDLTAAEAWQREHEAETGHRTFRTNSWSGGTGHVSCAGLGLETCTDGFRYRNTRDKTEELSS